MIRPSRRLRARRQERAVIVVNVNLPGSPPPAPRVVEEAPKFVPWG